MQDTDRLEPWLEDGNVVLSVEGKYFRVHRTILRSYSEIFKDMFSMPHSDDVEEKIDGCPVIHLQDAVADVEIVLRSLYDRSFHFFHDSPMPVPVLAAFLRLGKKYAIRQLFEEAKNRLSFTLPLLSHASMMSAKGNITLFPRVSENDPFNFRVMNIASEVGLLQPVVVAIYYACVACPASSIVNGYDHEGVRCTLSAANQQYIILGQRFLADVGRLLPRSVSVQVPPSGCQNRVNQNPCIMGLLLVLRNYLELRCPFTLWIASWDNGLCVNCRAESRRKFDDMRTKLWKNLPVDMGLGSWEDLENMAVIS